MSRKQEVESWHIFKWVSVAEDDDYYQVYINAIIYVITYDAPCAVLIRKVLLFYNEVRTIGRWAGKLHKGNSRVHKGRIKALSGDSILNNISGISLLVYASAPGSKKKEANSFSHTLAAVKS